MISPPLLGRACLPVFRPMSMFSTLPYSRLLHHAIPDKLSTSSVERRRASARKRSIDLATIQQLERLSLVDFANVAGVERLEAAIDFADVIRTVDTDGVEPLYTVLEEYKLHLRGDVAVEPENRRELMNIAVKSEEDYYVSPQGNVPLNPTQAYERS